MNNEYTQDWTSLWREVASIYDKWEGRINRDLARPEIEGETGLDIARFNKTFTDSIVANRILNESKAKEMLEGQTDWMITMTDVSLCIGYEYCEKKIDIKKLILYTMINSFRYCKQSKILVDTIISGKILSNDNGMKVFEAFVNQVVILNHLVFLRALAGYSKSCLVNYTKLADADTLLYWIKDRARDDVISMF